MSERVGTEEWVVVVEVWSLSGLWSHTRSFLISPKSIQFIFSLPDSHKTSSHFIYLLKGKRYGHVLVIHHKSDTDGEIYVIRNGVDRGCFSGHYLKEIQVRSLPFCLNLSNLYGFQCLTV